MTTPDQATLNAAQNAPAPTDTSVATGSTQTDATVQAAYNANVLTDLTPINPPPQKTLVYSPDVQILIARDNIQYDVSNDIVAWSIRRVENGVSSLAFQLANKAINGKLKYNQLFQRMDRVVVRLKRIEWVQVFSGYLDSVPFAQIYPGTVNFRASCTLKRLLHTWWDPSLPDSFKIFDQPGANAVEAANGEATVDAGLGTLLRRLLTEVGGWLPNTIHVQRFPIGFYLWMDAETQKLNPGNQKNVQDFRELILGTADTSGGVGKAAGAQVGVTKGGYAIAPPQRLLEVINAVDEMGMGPSTSDIAAAQGIGTAAQGGSDVKDQPGWKALNEVGTNWGDAALKNDAAVHCYMCIMAESGFAMFANASVPDSLGYPHDALSVDGTSVGLYQQQNFGEWGCLPAWSPVFTSTGPKPIVDVQEGDEVWSFTGDRMELAKVTGWQMTGHKRLLTVRTAGRALEVTANHRIPVRRYFGLADGRRQGECGWDTIEVCAGEIRRGDYLIVPHGMSDGSAVTAPDGDELSSEMMELIGLYLGDGNRDNNGRVEIAHGHGVDEDHMPYYRATISRILGVTPRVDKRGTRTRFNSPKFRALIDEWFPGKAHSKRVPGWVFRLTPELQLGLLRGYLDADGSVDRLGRISWTSVSEGLASDVRHLCIQLGIPVGVVGVRHIGTGTIRGKNHTTKTAYTIRASSVRHNRRIGARSPHKEAHFRSAPMPAKSRYDDDWNSSVCRRAPMGAPPEGTVYHRVIGIDQGTVEVPVYDIEVDGLHHYVADGVVVHNTVSQRMNVKASTQMFLQHLNRLDWRNMPRAIAIQQVQRSRFSDGSNYAGFETAAIEAVRAARAGTGTAMGTSGQTDLTSMLNPSLGLGGATIGAIPPIPIAAGVVDQAKSVIAGGVPTSNGTPTATAAVSKAGLPLYDSGGALSCALAQVGKPYLWGAKGPEAFDCSGLVQYAYRSIGLEVGQSTQVQRGQLERIPLSNIKPGDIIQPAGEEHTGLYVGAGQWIAAPQSGDVVRVQDIYFDLPSATILHVPGVEFGGVIPTAFDLQKAMSASNSPAGSVTGGLNGTTESGHTEPIARNLFTFQFQAGQFHDAMAMAYGGSADQREKAFINDEPLIQTVISFAGAGLRNFQSAPNGDFIAYYPDYFGVDGREAVWNLEDVEMKNVQIDCNDDAMATHVYVGGSLGQMSDGIIGWLSSSGVATVENQPLFSRMQMAAPHVEGEQIMDGASIMAKYGARPLVQAMSSIQTGAMEFLLACQLFMKKWAEQYATQIETTFMPEVFPGMRINLVNHNMQVYVSEVTHSGDFESGFTTSMTIMAPSRPSVIGMATSMFNATASDIASRRDLLTNVAEST